LAMARQQRSGTGGRAFNQHLLVLPAVHPPVPCLAGAVESESGFLAEHGHLCGWNAGVLCGLVLGRTEDGDQVVKSAVVLLSGGLDSMVCAGIAREQGYSVVALTVDYNQRHRVELEAARRI